MDGARVDKAGAGWCREEVTGVREERVLTRLKNLCLSVICMQLETGAWSGRGGNGSDLYKICNKASFEPHG